MRINLVDSRSPHFGLENSDKYRAYMAKYSSTLIQRNVKAKFILDTFPLSVKLEETYSEVRRNMAYPYLTTGTNAEDNVKSPCELKQISTIATAIFGNIFLETFSDKSYVLASKCESNFQTLPITKRDFIKGTAPPNITIRVVSELSARELINGTYDGSMHLNFRTIFFEPATSDDVTNYTALWDTAKSKNISVGCITAIQFTAFKTRFRSESSIDDCTRWHKKNPYSLIEWRSSSIIKDAHLSFILQKSLEHRQSFLRKYPTGRMFVRLPLFPANRTGLLTLDNYMTRNASGTIEQNLFCTRDEFGIQTFEDVAITWSGIHDFPIIDRPLIDTPLHRGWWFNIETESGLNRTITDVPLLVHRNLQTSVDEDLEFPNTFPCLAWNDHLLNYTVVQNKQFLGITVNLNFVNSSATAEVILALLHTALGRFKSVEIINCNTRNRLALISDAVSNINFSTSFPANVSSIFIEVNEFQDLDGYLKILNPTFPSFTGIHFAGWENQDSVTEDNIYTNLAKYQRGLAGSSKTDFGITVENCTHEINLGLRRVKALSYLRFLNYIVCITEPVASSNENKKEFQIYLDTHFYVQNYLKALLGLDIIFRVSFLPEVNPRHRMDTEKYLKFIIDMNQYAEGYGVRYFMGDAFSINGDNGWGWWNISQNSTVTQLTELESDYFGLETIPKYISITQSTNAPMTAIPTATNPTILNTIKASPTTNYLTWVIGTSTVIILAATISVTTWMYRRRQGDSEDVKSEESIEMLRGYADVEINKEDIALGAVLGGGNFALVYKGLLKGHTDVAVKVPNLQCIDSIWAEVKILYHLGSHENVIQFIGAYTQEIGRGVLYIITEFCGNGSLESYLKKLRPRQIINGNEQNASSEYVGYVNPDQSCETRNGDSVNLVELYRFSYEIASGMEYIAAQQVVHADLSTRNVMLAADMTCKIGDFGLSRKLYENLEYIKQGNEGLPWRWMAIESLKAKIFTTKSDVWSFGVTLWEIFSLGEIPYHGWVWSPDFYLALEENPVLRMDLPQFGNSEVYEIMVQCWNILPEERPTFTDLSSHFWSLNARISNM